MPRSFYVVFWDVCPTNLENQLRSLNASTFFIITLIRNNGLSWLNQLIANQRRSAGCSVKSSGKKNLERAKLMYYTLNIISYIFHYGIFCRWMVWYQKSIFRYSNHLVNKILHTHEHCSESMQYFALRNVPNAILMTKFRWISVNVCICTFQIRGSIKLHRQLRTIS